MQGLIRQALRRRPAAGRQLGVDLVVHPALAHAGYRGGRQRGQRPADQVGCGLGIVDAAPDPSGGESVVVDATGVPGGEEVVGRAHGRDGGQVRRVGTCGWQLGQAGVADPDHPNLVVGHPVLMGHNLHCVIGVVVGGVPEEVVGATRAAGPPHLEADGGEAGHPGHYGTHVGRRAG